MNRTFSSLAASLLFFTAVTASATDQTVQAALNKQYAGKTMVLRHPIAEDSQVYDATGKLLKGGDEGAWTLYGRFMATNVRLDKRSLVVEGERLLYLRSTDALAPAESHEKVEVEIKLARRPASAQQATALLGRVFCLTDEDVVKAAPPFWQNYLSVQLLHITDDAKPPVPSRANTLVVVELDDEGGVVKGSKTSVEIRTGVVRPRPLFTPEPYYTEAARNQRYQGAVVMSLVVDSAGNVRSPIILRPLGMGLDENAVKKVLTWRFDPGKVDGKPVNVLMNIESEI